MMSQERARATEQVAAMSQKLKDVQEMLFVKMREASQSHDCHMPLKAEISAMTALLEEEEKRSAPNVLVPTPISVHWVEPKWTFFKFIVENVQI